MNKKTTSLRWRALISALVTGLLVATFGVAPVAAQTFVLKPPYAEASTRTNCPTTLGCPGSQGTAEASSGRLIVSALATGVFVDPGTPPDVNDCYPGPPFCFDPQIPPSPGEPPSTSVADVTTEAWVTTPQPPVNARSASYEVTVEVANVDVTVAPSGGSSSFATAALYIRDPGGRARFVELASNSSPEAPSGTRTFRFETGEDWFFNYLTVGVLVRASGAARARADLRIVQIAATYVTTSPLLNGVAGT